MIWFTPWLAITHIVFSSALNLWLAVTLYNLLLNPQSTICSHSLLINLNAWSVFHSHSFLLSLNPWSVITHISCPSILFCNLSIFLIPTIPFYPSCSKLLLFACPLLLNTVYTLTLHLFMLTPFHLSKMEQMKQYPWTYNVVCCTLGISSQWMYSTCVELSSSLSLTIFTISLSHHPPLPSLESWYCCIQKL